MNYPLWDLPASGLLIAGVAILHVFVSHFAVGGGLFLVVTERKARRENDAELLGYLERHSRFFILLTLVFGAVTGVGIWFTIGLVHPAATSSLINAFVWGWAIEWAFFFTEIAAAIVYYYGWHRLSPRQHMTVGWIYFGTAWASLFVINGILSFMLTPGAWLSTLAFFDGFFNPTFWPSLVIRTLGAIGLAGVYALFTASWLASPQLASKLSRWAALWWILPMAVGLPLALLWYFAAAAGAGIPAAEVLGAASTAPRDLLAAVFSTASTGYPAAQTALRVAFAVTTFLVLLTFVRLLAGRRRFGRVGTALLMIAGLLSIGSSEWVREDLRKPFVIGSYMFVTGVRMPLPAESPAARNRGDDHLRIDTLAAAGMLGEARFSRLPAATRTASHWSGEEEIAAGREVFRLACAQCHTIGGYLAIRPLVAGRSARSIEGIIDRLAVPHAEGVERATWATPRVQLATWRHRQMPPFAGNEREKKALAAYLATLGQGSGGPQASALAGAAVFEASCSPCHGEGGAWPIGERIAGFSEEELYEAIGELPERNPMMPPFDGTEIERRQLAQWLANLAGGHPSVSGAAMFEESCAMCHGDGSDWPMAPLVGSWSEDDLYTALGELPERNDMMPPFEGSDEERRALALHLTTMAAGGSR
jgi:mono/diheme cytochrome c family protein